jgi:hypothetical protein
MTSKPNFPYVKYCQHHDMVWHPRTRTWKAVPPDFIGELRHADLPIDLIEWPCPRCGKPPSQ